MADGLNVASWWAEPEYKVCGTFQSRGYFILRKLHQLDAAKLRSVTADLSRDQKKEPQNITKVEWKVILKSMGATSEEIQAVQVRMGRWQ